MTERRLPLNRKTAWVAIRAYGEKAELAVPAYPHMLRHACGFALADQGADTRLFQDYLGHCNIQHTVMLFCGAGGLTHGLMKAGVDVRLGVDIGSGL